MYVDEAFKVFDLKALKHHGSLHALLHDATIVIDTVNARVKNAGDHLTVLNASYSNTTEDNAAWTNTAIAANVVYRYVKALVGGHHDDIAKFFPPDPTRQLTQESK